MAAAGAGMCPWSNFARQQQWRIECLHGHAVEHTGSCCTILSGPSAAWGGVLGLPGRRRRSGRAALAPSGSSSASPHAAGEVNEFAPLQNAAHVGATLLQAAAGKGIWSCQVCQSTESCRKWAGASHVASPAARP